MKDEPHRILPIVCVEISGSAEPAQACETPVAEGIAVVTKSTVY